MPGAAATGSIRVGGDDDLAHRSVIDAPRASAIATLRSLAIAALLFTAVLFPAVLFPAVLFTAGPADAQPARGRILEDLRVVDRCLRIGFSFPLQYYSHYPARGGDEIRIRLKPLSISPVDRDALARSESGRPPYSDSLPISEILYEGDLDGGPYLTIRFEREIAFEVRQGRSFRSVFVVAITEQGSESRCPAGN